MYRCNLTGRVFDADELVTVESAEYGDTDGCPCCGDAEFYEVERCDVCGGYTGADNSLSERGVLCSDCRRAAIVTLFDFGAGELGTSEEEYLDDLLALGNSWSDLKKLYKEAKQC